MRPEPFTVQVDLTQLFAPAILTQAQQEDRYERCRGERKLWLAVLNDAAAIYLGRKMPMVNGSSKPGSVRRTIAEACEWVETEDVTIGGFDWACELLGIGPTWLRERLRSTKTGRKQLA